MHISVTFFDSESQPRTLRFSPRQAAAEKPLQIRTLMALQALSAATRLTVDVLTTTAASHQFTAAVFALFLDAEAMRKLEADPSNFPKIVAKFMPQPQPQKDSNGTSD